MFGDSPTSSRGPCSCIATGLSTATAGLKHPIVRRGAPVNPARPPDWPEGGHLFGPAWVDRKMIGLGHRHFYNLGTALSRAKAWTAGHPMDSGQDIAIRPYVSINGTNANVPRAGSALLDRPGPSRRSPVDVMVRVVPSCDRSVGPLWRGPCRVRRIDALRRRRDRPAGVGG